MNRVKKTIAGIFFGIICVCAQAQISVDVPGVVGLNEQFNITFTLGEKPSSFEWTAGDDFQLVWGPQTGSSTSISIVNGKHSKQSRYTYTYVLLPRQNGTFSIPAARAVVDGKEIYSKAVSIQVVSNGASAPQSSSGAASSGSSSGAASGNSSSSDIYDRQVSRPSSSQEDIFMRLSVNRTNVVVGEPIIATLKLYTRSNVAGFEDAKFPAFNGFWAQEIESPQNISFQRESVGERIYSSAVLRKWMLIPQKSGSVTIEPAELVTLLQQRVTTGNSIFDGFFDDYQTVRKRLVSASHTIKVDALPAGAPASFSGAVGSFKISARLSSDSLKVHDAASLIVTVSGKGNVALVGAPKVNFPPDSEIYDTKTTDRIDQGSGGTSGSKSFEYPFIPRSHGDFEIPAIDFTYYDVTSRRYVTVSTNPIPYNVAKGAATDYVPAEGVNIPVAAHKDVKSLSDDIRYISTRMPKLSSHNSFYVGSTLYWLAVAFAFLAAAAVYFGVRGMRRRNSDVVRVRTRGASKAARKRLGAALGYLEKNLYGAYYEELHKALLCYAADKLNIASADLSKESIAASFASAGAPQDTVDEYVALLDACEFARYAPSGSNEAMKESYDKAVDVISVLDSNMKKGVSKAGAAALLLCLGLGGTGIQAQAADSYVDSLWNAGVQAYQDGDYVRSARDFTAIESLGLSSPELYTNAADAYFKNGDYAMSILYYERALKLDPSFKDAAYNLEIARGHVLDRIESVPEFFLRSWNRSVCYSLSSNQWAVLFFLILTLFLTLVVVFLLTKTPLLKKFSFFIAIFAVIFASMCLGYSLSQKSDFEKRDQAIVTRAVCAAKSSPSAASGSDLFILHEGTKVVILDTVGEWVKIEIADGRQAWVQSVDVCLI